MLRNTLRMINQQDQWFNQLRREESARRTLRYSLYQALEQVERLLESDMMEVPIEMQARLRQIVEAVDSQLAYRMDQSGPLHLFGDDPVDVGHLEVQTEPGVDAR